MRSASAIYSSLSIFVLFTALFVLHSSNDPEVSMWQIDMTHQFSTAWQQTIGDQPYFDDLAYVYDSIASFYDQSTNATIAMFSEPEADADIAYVYGKVFHTITSILKPTAAKTNNSIYDSVVITIPANFMTEEPLYNIVPAAGDVAGLKTNSAAGWQTIQDEFTGQTYCVAIYNGEVNKYLGKCKNDYH